MLLSKTSKSDPRQVNHYTVCKNDKYNNNRKEYTCMYSPWHYPNYQSKIPNCLDIYNHKLILDINC